VKSFLLKERGHKGDVMERPASVCKAGAGREDQKREAPATSREKKKIGERVGELRGREGVELGVISNAPL